MNIGSVISAMINYLQGNLHEIEHMLKVYAYAKAIGEAEGLNAAKLRTLEIAAVVHDIGIPEALRKYGSDAGPYQEELGPGEARKLLHALGCDCETLERVCFLVGHHHSWNSVDDIDYRILLEADFLVNAAHQKLSREAILAAKENFFRTQTALDFLDKCLLHS